MQKHKQKWCFISSVYTFWVATSELQYDKNIHTFFYGSLDFTLLCQTQTLRFASWLLQKERKMSSQSNTLPNENFPICKLIAAKRTENVFTVKLLAKWELSDLQVDCCKKNGKCLHSQTPCQMRTLRFASWLLQNKRKMSSQSNTLPDENSLICKLIAAKKQRKNVFTVKHLARWELSGSQVHSNKQSRTVPRARSAVQTFAKVEVESTFYVGLPDQKPSAHVRRQSWRGYMRPSWTCPDALPDQVICLSSGISAVSSKAW